METLRFDVTDKIATLRLYRPERKNALNLQMRTELTEVMSVVRADQDIRVLIITGADGAFCAGGDIAGMSNFSGSSEKALRHMQGVSPWLDTLLNVNRPTIAAVDGVAFGAGFSLALACDLVLASSRARFCMSFVRVGLMPDCGATYTLPRIVGLQRAKEIMFSAREIGANEALSLGIATEVHAPENLEQRARAMAQAFVNGSATAVSLTKQALNASLGSNLQTMLSLEASGQSVALSTDYHHDAVKSFQEKKPVAFQWPN